APGRAAGAADAAPAQVDLSDRMEQPAGTLSRGLRQRLAIAQAIVHRPAVLLLDEPAAGLDPQARRDLSQLLLALKAGGMTLVVSSHILAELEDYSDRMVIVDHGRIAGGEAITLRGAKGGLRVTLAVSQPGLAEALARAGATVVESSDRHAVAMLAGGADARSRLLAALVQDGFAVSDFTEDARNLEEVYFSRVRS
ncbi:MAG TPA: ABC transporter ATP-binding protein, partial [Rhizomicrobium sp.]|nr:ABC transporter ATP-binding protein [Rhizomicrobium sp.]